MTGALHPRGNHRPLWAALAASALLHLLTLSLLLSTMAPLPRHAAVEAGEHSHHSRRLLEVRYRAGYSDSLHPLEGILSPSTCARPPPLPSTGAACRCLCRRTPADPAASSST